ncbi:hypothetical protein D9756_010549 [Leucocoprinus leucothites]|uniref:Transmembrane protein n=1 Tax=Leucocoprinus leucothites TaxID=201217 RepID=A0A8H5CRT1_9AGAR|nr:hypothetical protein D9756_010549 [Leucoagaricus leucothites]
MNNTPSHCQAPPAAIETSLIVGSNISSFCYGIMILLGFLSFNALRRQSGGKSPRVRIGLMCWILVTVIVGTTEQALDISIVVNQLAANGGRCTSEDDLVSSPFGGNIGVVWLLTEVLADGLLVWRCYMIAASFDRRWLLAWLVPLILYIGAIVLGVVLLAQYTLLPKQGKLANDLLVIVVGVSLLLNVIISSSIVLLLIHFKNIATKSASLIIVSDVLTVTTLVLRSSILLIPLQMWDKAQAIASLLIIYQVARGVDYFSGKDEVTSDIQQNSSNMSILDVKPEEV